MKIVYAADDGAIFETEQECQAYEHTTLKSKALTKHIEENIEWRYDSDFHSDVIEIENVRDYILDNWKEIKEIVEPVQQTQASEPIEDATNDVHFQTIYDEDDGVTWGE